MAGTGGRLHPFLDAGPQSLGPDYRVSSIGWEISGGGAHRTGINIARPEQWANEVTGLWWPHQPALHTPLTNSPFLETMTQPPTPMTLFPYSTLKKPCSQSSPKCLPEVQTAES